MILTRRPNDCRSACLSEMHFISLYCVVCIAAADEQTNQIEHELSRWAIIDGGSVLRMTSDDDFEYIDSVNIISRLIKYFRRIS